MLCEIVFQRNHEEDTFPNLTSERTLENLDRLFAMLEVSTSADATYEIAEQISQALSGFMMIDDHLLAHGLVAAKN